MDYARHHALIVVTICLSSLLFISPSPTHAAAAIHAAPTKLVKEICGQTKNYTFCVEALESDRRTVSASDLVALTKIALELSIANATSSRAYIDDQLKSNETEPAKRPSLKACVSSYDAVVASFKSALLEVIEDEDYQTANYDVAIAGDEANNCEQSLASAGFQDLSITTRNNFIKSFSNIGYVLTDLLDMAADAPSHLVRESCNKTTLTQWNYTFCVEALESDPRNASTSDLLTLTNIAIELAIANATKAQAHLYDMLKNSDTGSNFKAPLEGYVRSLIRYDD
ncbi:hypothetical protein L1049_026988 [Liquidambar formosana]|uniref:Pectinesterase inhibitor domain-containing protein n=1 Tax=Liquidambar formosana TaxID=63359 RepID=A0AAP0NED2_LIQFO